MRRSSCSYFYPTYTFYFHQFVNWIAEEHLLDLKEARQDEVAQRLAAAEIAMSDLQEFDHNGGASADTAMNRDENDGSMMSDRGSYDGSLKYRSEDDDGDDDSFFSGENYDEDDDDSIDDPSDMQQQQQQQQQHSTIISSGQDHDTNIDGTRENSENDAPLPPILPHYINDEARALARKAAREKRLAARKSNQAQRLRANAEASRLEAVRAHAAKITENCITTEEKVNDANVQSLMKQLDKVDELLESLQEDVWADEEEEEFNVNPTDDNSAEHDPVSDGNFNTGRKKKLTLLDQILAMVLFSLPNLRGLTDDVFMAYKRKQHLQIVKEWKEHFGCLPPPIFTENSGVDDNEEATFHASVSVNGSTEGVDANEMVVTDDWEDLADDDSEILDATATLKPKGALPTVSQGRLRPGGRI